jgi:hypothetical protein
VLGEMLVEVLDDHDQLSWYLGCIWNRMHGRMERQLTGAWPDRWPPEAGAK